MLRVTAILAAFALTAWIGVVALAQGSDDPSSAPATISSTDQETEDVDVDEVDHEDDQGENEDDQGENEDD